MDEHNCSRYRTDIFSCEKQLYKRLCPSVGPSVRPSVGQAFLENRKFKKIQVSSTKFNKIQQNSRLFATVGRVTALLVKTADTSGNLGMIPQHSNEISYLVLAQKIYYLNPISWVRQNQRCVQE